MMIQDAAGSGYQALGGQTFGMMGRANQTPGLAQVYTLFNTDTPRVFADIDRAKADLLGVPPSACSRRCRSISARPL
jgi:multidrug efflux pump subunit AcrB